VKIKDKGNCFYINKVKDGILITTKEICEKQAVKIGVRVPADLMGRLNNHLSNQSIKISRTSWILQAIQDRLNREDW
jgi:hypothetical protein